MKKRDEKDDLGWGRDTEDDEDRVEMDLQDVRTDLLSCLKPDYSWIQHFQALHPGWQFLRFDDIPWQPLRKPLSECRLAYVSLAGVYLRGQKPFNVAPSAVSEECRRMRFKMRGDWSYREIPRDAAAAELQVATAHFDSRMAEEDINCVFPVDRLLELEFENIVGSLHGVHYSLMGYVPEWRLLETGAAVQIGENLQGAGIDVVLLSPGCLLSHQSMAVLQRSLERRGLSTVSLSLCPDVTEQIGVPRAVALRHPLGNSFGAPQETMTQYRILRDAVLALEEIQEPGTLIELPYEWAKD